jgi:hypothetical protein
MRIVKLAVAATLLATCPAAAVQAQDAAATGLRQPRSVQQTAFEYDKYIAFGADNGAAASPSDQPAPPKSEGAAVGGEGKAAEAQPQEQQKEEEKAEEDTGFKLFKSSWLKCHNIDIRGWLDQGYTWNPDSPTNRSNLPVGYNDRSNDYMLNQLYFIAERVTKTDGCGWDVGGRVDMLYGTDRRFVTAAGFDSNWNGVSPTTGLAMPQLYGDLALNDLIVRVGHILAPCGFENVMAPENFFYSHTYEFLYEQPTTLTGGQLIYKINDRLTTNAGIDTGWNDFTDVSNKLNYYGGFNWTNKCQTRTFALEIFSGAQFAGVNSNRVLVNTVFTQKLGKKWKYALETNLASENNSPVAFGGPRDASWYGIANYLFYEVNECWSWGMRYEWTEDRNGAVIPSGAVLATGLPADYNALTAGVNYKPNKNVVFRSEVRGDWATMLVNTNQRPFDDMTRSQQFLWGNDLIVRF